MSLVNDWYQILKNEFETRKNRNPSYSLRAYSRDVGISQAQLSRLFLRQRKLGPEQAYRVAQFFGLNQHETFELIVSTFDDRK